MAKGNRQYKPTTPEEVEEYQRSLEAATGIVSQVIARRGGFVSMQEAIRRAQERDPRLDPKDVLEELGEKHDDVPGFGFVGGDTYPDELEAAQRVADRDRRIGGEVEVRFTVVGGERRWG